MERNSDRNYGSRTLLSVPENPQVPPRDLVPHCSGTDVRDQRQLHNCQWSRDTALSYATVTSRIAEFSTRWRRPSYSHN